VGDATRVRAVIERLIGDGRVVARSDGTVHDLFPVAISAAEGQALRGWVQQERPTHTIEVGLGYGVAALFICEGLLASRVVSPRHVVIDPHQSTRFTDCGLQVLDEASLSPLVEHHPDSSEIVLPRLLSEGRSFDLAFVDGNHRFEGIFLDLSYLGRLLRPRGIIFIDDYQLPSIRRAAAFFTTNLGWTLEETSTEDELHCWAVLRTSPEPAPRAFDHYVDF
jgi:predicted O-methyltransferase YrrM